VVTPTGNADWTGCNADTLVQLIATASKKGGALRFGYTRDGGAYAIGVYCGQEYFTDYIRPGESIDDYLNTLLRSFDDWEPTTGANPKPAGNKRK
jgi:hypothetical protein